MTDQLGARDILIQEQERRIQELELERIHLLDTINSLRIALDDIAGADDTSTLGGAVAIANVALGRAA
jgi:hypothetical protein